MTLPCTTFQPLTPSHSPLASPSLVPTPSPLSWPLPFFAFFPSNLNRVSSAFRNTNSTSLQIPFPTKHTTLGRYVSILERRSGTFARRSRRGESSAWERVGRGERFVYAKTSQPDHSGRSTSGLAIKKGCGKRGGEKWEEKGKREEEARGRTMPMLYSRSFWPSELVRGMGMREERWRRRQNLLVGLP
jgi:hypothetical protein